MAESWVTMMRVLPCWLSWSRRARISCPVAEYLAKAGYTYAPTYATGQYKPNAGKFTLGYDGTHIVVTALQDADLVTQELGIRVGDAVLKFIHDGNEIGIFDGVKAAISKLQPGEEIGWIILRDGKEMQLSAKVRSAEVIQKHHITPMANLTKSQQEFRTWWFTNL